MKWLLIGLLPVLFSCARKKEQISVPGGDISVLRTHIAERTKQIDDAKQRKDTARLTQLYPLQADDYRKTGNWAQFYDQYMTLYNLNRFTNPEKMMMGLDSIIAYENNLVTTDTLRSRLAEAFFIRADELGMQERFTRSVDDYEKYFELAGDRANKSWMNYALNTAGNGWLRIGDKQQAITCLEKAKKYAEILKSPEDISVASINLANAYRENNEPGKAITTVESALIIPGIPQERRAYLNAVLAEVYNQQNKPAEATVFVNKALPLLHGLPQTAEEKNNQLSVVYSVKGDVLSNTKNATGALEAYRRAIEHAQVGDSGLHSREVAKIYIAMGRVHLSLAQTDSALVYYDKALKAVFPIKTGVGLNRLPDERQLFHENTIMEAFDAASEAYVQQYNTAKDTALLQKSLQCVRLAFKVEELLRRFYIYDNSKYSDGYESKSRSEQGIQTCRMLWAATKEKKWLNEAFLFAEKSRANVLRDKMKENLLFSSGADSSIIAARQTWYKINSIEDELQHLKNDTAETARVQTLTKEKEKLEAEFARNKNQVNNLLQKNTHSAKKQDDDFSGLQQRMLNSNDAVIEYFAGDSLLYRFVWQKGKEDVELVTLPLHTADSLVRALLPYLTEREKYNTNPDGYPALATQLYQLIFPALTVQAEKIEEVVVIPDGILQSLPFEALMTNTAKPEFLLNRFRIKSAFSCTSYLQQLDMPAGTFEMEAMAFAPFMENSVRMLPVLRQSKTETDALGKMSSTTQVIANKNATEKKFMDLAGKGQILHIASHAFASGSDSAQPRIEFADSSLSLGKIYALQLNTKLVVLSACQTGIGRLETAEGALSLARGFYYAGARNVINSLWEVDDESAGFIFQRFYHHLKKNGNISQSLALARREYIAQAKPEKQSPYYWASFASVGDGYYAESSEKARFRFMLIGIFGVIGTGVLIYVFRRKNEEHSISGKSY